MVNYYNISIFLMLVLIFSFCSCKSETAGAPPDFAVPVVVAKAKMQRVVDQVSVVGTLAANEMVELQSEIDGLVEEIAFEEGQKVQKGVLLFTINKEALSALVSEAEANFKLAEANLRRGEALVKNNTISSKEYDQALAEFKARQASLSRVYKELKDAAIIAPFDGVMGARFVSPGQFVSRGQALSSIHSVQTVKVEVEIPERYLSKLVTGLKIETEVDAYSGVVFEGEIFFIAPQVKLDTRTLLVKALIPNEEQKLKPGMLAKVRVIFSARDQAIVIPESAVMLQKDSATVFVVSSDNLVEIRPVKIGARLKGELEIFDGIQVGDSVIVEGTQKIGPGSKISIVDSRAALSSR